MSRRTVVLGRAPLLTRSRESRFESRAIVGPAASTKMGDRHYSVMSLAVVYSRALAGLDAPLVRVEVHVGGGLPCTNIVGLPERKSARRATAFAPPSRTRASIRPVAASP